MRAQPAPSCQYISGATPPHPSLTHLPPTMLITYCGRGMQEGGVGVIEAKAGGAEEVQKQEDKDAK